MIVGVEAPGEFSATANILDISLSGAYILLSGHQKPKIGQKVDINFSDVQFKHPETIGATIKYVNGSSLIGIDVYGVGLEFHSRLPENYITNCEFPALCIGGRTVEASLM